MWLTSSSIGRKFVMALTGACLVLFVTFHVVMNAVCILWPAAYNQVCMFLGANWYALVASLGLAALFIIHIIYAVWLTLQNRKARGADRYAVTSRPPQVEWSSKNMLVLGLVILAFLVVHLIQFWAKMQLQEILGTTAHICDGESCIPAPPEFGTLFIQAAFSQIWVPIVYIIGFAALWFHMTHGFWSMFHSVGWDNNIWLSRLKCIGCWWTSIVVALFTIQAIVFTVQAKNNYYLNAPELQAQYSEYFNEEVTAFHEKFQADVAAADLNKQPTSQEEYMAQQTKVNEFIVKYFPGYIETLQAIVDGSSKLCPDMQSQELKEAQQMLEQFPTQLETAKASLQNNAQN